jgi:hypothetical protein
MLGTLATIAVPDGLTRGPAGLRTLGRVSGADGDPPSRTAMGPDPIGFETRPLVVTTNKWRQRAP